MYLKSQPRPTLGLGLVTDVTTDVARSTYPLTQLVSNLILRGGWVRGYLDLIRLYATHLACLMNEAAKPRRLYATFVRRYAATARYRYTSRSIYVPLILYCVQNTRYTDYSTDIVHVYDTALASTIVDRRYRVR